MLQDKCIEDVKWTKLFDNMPCEESLGNEGSNLPNKNRPSLDTRDEGYKRATQFEGIKYLEKLRLGNRTLRIE